MLKRFISADQAAKLVHQLILLTIAFLCLVDKREVKAHICYPITKAVSEAARE